MQADLAPLASSLIGLPLPLNNVGVLPLTYLAPSVYRATVVVANAAQIYAQAAEKARRKAVATLWFRPYAAMETLQTRLVNVRASLINSTEQTWQHAEAECFQIIHSSLAALGNIRG